MKKIVNRTNKSKTRQLALIRAALFGACVFGLGAATCMAQVPTWSSDGPPSRLSEEAEQQAKLDRKASEERAFQEKFRRDFVQKINECKVQIAQSIEQAQAQAQASNYGGGGGGDFVAGILDSFVPSIPGPFSPGDIYRTVTSDQPLLTAGRIAANWGISQIDIPVVPTLARIAADRVFDNYSAAISAQYAVSQSQISLQTPLNNLVFRNSDQRTLSASNFALGESVNMDELNVLVQNQTDRFNDRFGLPAFYKDDKTGKKLEDEKSNFLTGLREVPEFADSVKATLDVNDKLTQATLQATQNGYDVNAANLVDQYITPEYFVSLRKMTDIFSPESQNDDDLLKYAEAFDKSSNLGMKTATDSYGRTYTTYSLFAADVFGRYGVVCMQRSRENSGKLGKELLATGESLLQKSLEIADKRFAQYPGYRAQWSTCLAVRCQFAGFNDRARELYEESEKVAANALTTTRGRTGTPSRQPVNDIKTRRAWNAEMACRAMALDNRFEDVQKYADVVIQTYESWNAPKHDANANARLPRELYAEAKANLGLAKFLRDFDVDARFQLEEAKEKFDQYASASEGQTSFVVEEQTAIYCRLAQLAARVEKYDEALEYVNSAIDLKRKFLEEQKKNWEGHRRYFEIVPTYFEAVYAEETLEYCDANGKIHKLDAEELAKRKEKWNSIVESRLSYEKNLKASILYKRGDPETDDLAEALKNVDEILETLVICGLDETQAMSETLMTRAQIERRLGSLDDLHAAKEDLEKASEILNFNGVDVEEFEKAPNSTRAYFEGSCACERAHVERELAAMDEDGAAKRAREFYDAAERYYKNAVVSNAAFVDLYYGRATLNRITGDKQEAYDALNKAIERSLEVRKTSAVNDQDRALRLSQFAYLFEAKAAWLLEDSTDDQETVAALYETMETARTQSFEDLATMVNFDLTTVADEQTLDELDAKQKKLEEAEKALIVAENNLDKVTTKGASSTSSKEYGIYEKSYEEYSAARNDYNAYRTKLARKIVTKAFDVTQDKGFVDDVQATQSRGGFEEIQQLAIDSNLVVCEYMLGENNCYLTVFGVGVEPKAYELRLGDRETEKLLRKTEVELESGALTAEKLNVLLTGILSSVNDDSTKNFKAYSSVLWTTLFPEELRKLMCDEKCNFDLMIVPDGALFQLSFNMLVVDDGETTGDEPTYLLDLKPAVFKTPSGWVYSELSKRGKKEESEKVLTVGNPETELGSLEYSETEVKNIVEICKKNKRFSTTGSCRSFIGKEATEKNVIENLNRTFNHLAVHADVDRRKGKMSGALLLTSGAKADGKNDSTNDGVLTISEILRSDLRPCELMILSACGTNCTSRQKDEGVWSLAQAIMLAGARRVVASNWKVNDGSTSELISEFTKKVLDESASASDCARALKEAQKEIKEQDGWSSPYYWAPFELIGTP